MEAAARAKLAALEERVEEARNEVNEFDVRSWAAHIAQALDTVYVDVDIPDPKSLECMISAFPLTVLFRVLFSNGTSTLATVEGGRSIAFHVGGQDRQVVIVGGPNDTSSKIGGDTASLASNVHKVLRDVSAQIARSDAYARLNLKPIRILI